MSDRITIDHIRNNIIIQVHSTTLATMDNHSILSWIKTFLQTLEESHLHSELAGDNSTTSPTASNVESPISSHSSNSNNSS